jgi:flagellar biosynthesis GTPase FlhF
MTVHGTKWQTQKHSNNLLKQNKKMSDTNGLAYKLSGGRDLETMRQMFSADRRKRDTEGAQKLTEEQLKNYERFFEIVGQEKKTINTDFKSLDFEETKRLLNSYLVKSKFKVTNLNKPVLSDLSAWLSGCSVQNDKNEIELDATKGIFLCGGTGNGKTTLVKLLQKIAIQNDNYRFRHFKIKNTSELLSDMASGHIPMQNDYNGNWCFDDVGVNYYEVS